MLIIVLNHPRALMNLSTRFWIQLNPIKNPVFLHLFKFLINSNKLCGNLIVSLFSIPNPRNESSAISINAVVCVVAVTKEVLQVVLKNLL